MARVSWINVGEAYVEGAGLVTGVSCSNNINARAQRKLRAGAGGGGVASCGWVQVKGLEQKDEKPIKNLNTTLSKTIR